MTRKIKYFLIFSLGFLVFFSLVPAASAQINAGLNVVGNTIQLSSTSPIEIAARIINIFLLVLGIIAVCLVIFAGFKWMTSNGNEEKISEAKKVLQNALIGLAIILCSWGIVTWIFAQFFGITGGGSGIFGGAKQFGAGGGFGAIGSCTVQTVYPTPGQTDVARNTSIMITFNTPIPPVNTSASMCINSASSTCACDNAACNLINPSIIHIYKDNDGDHDATNLKDVTITEDSTSSPTTFVLKPVTPLGSSAGNTDYSVYITNDILDSNGQQIFKSCYTNYLKWGFQVNNLLDLTPPEVSSDGLFPPADNTQDTVDVSSTLSGASGTITVNSEPQTYVPAAIISVATATPENLVAGVIDSNYHGASANFTVTVADNTKARLYNSASQLLDEEDVTGGQISFPNYFTLTIKGDQSWAVGNSWKVGVQGENPADTLTVANDTYTFTSAATGGYNIQALSSLDQQAAEIVAALSGRTDVIPNSAGDKVILNAVTQGVAGNGIGLSVASPDGHLAVSSLMSGGRDAVTNVTTQDQPDQPMNSAIQITFNEAINPMMVSGSAADVFHTIRVVNNKSGAKNSGATCSTDDECLSYKCNGSSCDGDYLAGKFTISNGYKTVGFTTDNECGINGCGGKIYCLPANSNLRVEVVAADLIPCTNNNNSDYCTDMAPYSACRQSTTSHGQLGYKTCQDSHNINYPGAPAMAAGVIDAASNSLNGNSDNMADGPVSWYDENAKIADYKDNFRWSFWISDKMIATPPTVTNIFPSVNQSSVSLTAPIAVTFDRLMKADTLKTGSIDITTGTSTVVTHQLINLLPKSGTGPAVGYWVTNDVYIATSTNEYSTTAKINHSSLVEALDYRAQVGSGVNDIYQNCFKPSSGLGCNTSQNISTPSCCNGSSTAASTCTF